MTISVRTRSILVFAFDLLAAICAWFGAFLLRFNLDWPHEYATVIWLGLIPVLIIQGLFTLLFRLHRSMWTFTGFPELLNVLKAVATSMLLLSLTLLLYPALIPRSIVLLYPLLLLLAMGGSRAIWRMWREYRTKTCEARLENANTPVVVVGAGMAGAMLVRELRRSPQWRIVGLVDDDPTKWGLDLSGHRVFGDIDHLPEILEDTGARHVVVAIPSSQTQALRRITELVRHTGVSLLTVPDLGELMNGRVAINAMRPVRIEDLLGRASIHIDNDHISAMISGNTVLVTGAGGSIGSELCRQVARFTPKRIILLETSEFALYSINQWFLDNQPDIPVIPLAGDVKDQQRLTQIFTAYQPELVLHAAAYKHVPLMEVNNAWQAVRNNVMGTLNVALCAQQSGSKRFVLISTDKAVNPTNVMGATKRMAEMACEALNCQNNTTSFTMVRFGNVLGSTGSVIPRFKEQIANGGPVTVTHPDITRYFMLIPEAAQLVLQAASMGTGGEVFVMDMGEPVRIADLARNMIRLAGFSEQQIGIKFTGLRPGEKLYEELLADNEQTLPTPHSKLRIAQSRTVENNFLQDLIDWLENNKSVPDSDVRLVLKRWIPEYMPGGDGSSSSLPQQQP
ncbi:polysaccharide biosynthesis protein [Alcaligenaceae bacterium SJ-26]|nr:polysaccharide biosynthesis protein [Alcaligenaceae bacterium SJ-26]